MFKILELNSKLFVESFDTSIKLSKSGKNYTDLENVILDLKILDKIKCNDERFKIFKL